MVDGTFTFRAMNTNVHVWFQSESNSPVKPIEELKVDLQLLFHQVEQTCSRFLPDSELTQLNHAGNQGGEVGISPLMRDLLAAAEDAYLETEGIFHPGLLRQLQSVGYSVSFEKLPFELEEDQRQERDLTAVPEFPYQLNRAKRQVRLLENAQIDLGGIAKGWTVDKAAEYLSSYGCGFVNAGGDLRTFGKPKEPWVIGIEDPFEPERDITSITLVKGAIATSSTVKRRWKKGSSWQHHLLDPCTGKPSTSSIASATVTAPTALQADVWAKTVLLLGTTRGAAFLQRRKQLGVWVEHSRKVRFINI